MFGGPGLEEDLFARLPVALGFITMRFVEVISCSSKLIHIHRRLRDTCTSHPYIAKTAHSDRLSPAAQTNQKYAIVCAAVCCSLSLLIVFLHTRPLLSSVILGTKVEGGAILVLLTLWPALVAIVSDTR